MAASSSNSDDSIEDTGTGNHRKANGPVMAENSPASKIVIPETPSPSVPKKRLHQPGNFDIAEQLFADPSPPRSKGTKKKLNTDFLSSGSSRSQSGATLNRRANSDTLSSKVNLPSTAEGKSSSSINGAVLKHHKSPGKNKVSRTAIISSSESDEEDELPLFQRIQKKRKLDRKNGLLQNRRPQEETAMEMSVRRTEQSDSKRIKLVSTRKDRNQGSSHGKVKASQSSDSATGEHDLQRSPAHKAGTSKSGVGESLLGPSTSERSKVKKKSPPGNTVRNSKNNVIHQRIKDMFGSDSESEDNNTLEETRTKQAPKPGLMSKGGRSGSDDKVKKKSAKPAEKNKKRHVQQQPNNAQVHGRNHSHHRLNERGEASVRGSQPTTSTGPDRNRTKRKQKIKSTPILSDSSDTDTEISLLTSRPVRGRNMCNKAKEDKRSNSGNSDVELMSIGSTPEKSPVFNGRSGSFSSPERSITPVMRRIDDEDSSEDGNNVAVENSSEDGNNVAVENSAGSDSDDVVTIDDDVEVIAQASSRRRSPHHTHRRDRTNFGDALNRRVGRTSELGSPINLDTLRVPSPPSSPPQLGPSFRHEVQQRRRAIQGGVRIRIPSGSITDGVRIRIASGSQRRRSNQEDSNRGARARTTSGGSSGERRRRQLESDEQLARDFASGRIRTPTSGRGVRRGRGSTGKRNRQVAEDEALARELASGNIRTPVTGSHQGAPSQQVDDDEALARQLQEQFNAEALEETHRRDSDEADNESGLNTMSFNVPGQYPSSFRYEMALEVSSLLRPYPTLSGSHIMSPVILGDVSGSLPDDVPPRTRSRTRGRGRGRARGRGRGRRGRSSGDFHIQFFPMDPDETLDDDYETLWELADRVGPAVQQGLSPEVLSLLPTFTYKASDASASGEEEEGQSKNCTICMMEYEDGENLRRLPCFHHYHTACIDRWLAENSACPVCQTRVSLDEPIIE